MYPPRTLPFRLFSYFTVYEAYEMLAIMLTGFITIWSMEPDPEIAAAQGNLPGQKSRCACRCSRLCGLGYCVRMGSYVYFYP